MSPVYKHHAPSWRHLDVVNRRELEDFPEDERVTYTLEPEVEPEDEPPEEVDPEAIRAAVFEEARIEAERLVQEAYAEGLRRGEEAGRAAFDEQVANSIEIIPQTAQLVREATEAFLVALEPETLALSVTLAERVLRREIRCDLEIVRTIVRHALEKLVDRHRLVVRVNPEDLSCVQEYASTLKSAFTDIVELHVEADSEISRGGCAVDSDTAHADAAIETMFEELLALLEE